jgi:predicted metal-dependent HD superfamily phosphohydrolase
MDAERLKYLRRSVWPDPFRPFGVPVNRLQEPFWDLERRYAELGRHYHTLDHVDAVVHAARGLLRPTPPAVELAAWFHDAVYDPRAGDNEERSAEYAREVLKGLGVPADVREETARLILLTRSHEASPDDVPGCAFLDADLAILAAEPAAYDEYAAAIRREYAWVPEAEYRAGRRRVLERFLARGHLFHTPLMKGAPEARARVNLAREVASLGGS